VNEYLCVSVTQDDEGRYVGLFKHVEVPHIFLQQLTSDPTEFVMGEKYVSNLVRSPGTQETVPQ
jgi:hypothetical protein